jgi:DNA uptake protein ComE-like DNA-binding protein
VSFVVKQFRISIPKSKLDDHRPVGRLIAMGKQRNRSVLVADTLIIISYHELSRVDWQSHSCYDKRDEKVGAMNTDKERKTLEFINSRQKPEDLLELPLTPPQAHALFRYCGKYGHLASLDELLKVNGIGERTLEKIKDWVPQLKTKEQKQFFTRQQGSSENRQTPHTSNTKRKEPTRGETVLGIAVLVAVAIFVGFCTRAIFLDDQSERASSTPSPPSASSTTSKPAPSYGQGSRITGDARFGFTDREYFNKTIDYLVQGDEEAFHHALTLGLMTGVCTLFEDGEIVYITDTAIFSGLVKVRRQGEFKEYWITLESIE